MMGSTSRNEVLVFYERAPLSDVFLPIKTTARVKYTCFDISRKYLALGATSGSVYIFNREPLHFLQAIVNNEGLLEGISIGPHENILAIATCKGTVVLVEFTWEQSSFVFRRIFSSYDHRDSHVTYLKWSPNGSRLFVGDDKGKVTVITFTLAKAVPLLQPRTALVAKLESAVVQLDFALEKILISTLNWCYLCDTEREQYSSIGKKPREGAFGSCFYSDAKLENPLIYSARPGSRIWEVDFEGNVLCTHQLKKSLAQAPACLILYNEPTKFASLNDFWPPQSLNFKKLIVIGKDHLLACTADSVFIFEPSDVVDVVLWCKLPQTINDIRADKNDIYIRYESGNMQKLQVLVVERCVRDLLERGLWNESAKLCLNYELPVINTRARRVLPYSMMKLLVDRLDDEQLRSNIQAIVNKLQQSEKQECLERTREGIFVVSRGQRRFDWEDDSDRTNDRESPARHFWSGFRPISPYYPVVPVKVEECQSTPQFRHLRRKSEDLDPSAVMTQFSNAVYESPRSLNSISRSSSCGNWKLGTPDNEGMDGVKNTPGIFFEDFRQSVSAKVTSGTFKILRTMGDIEDRFKESLANSIPELLDVDVGNETGKKLDGYNSRNYTSSFSESVVCLPLQSSSTGDVPKSVIIGSYDSPNIDLDDFLAETISAWKWLENSEVYDILRTKETLSRWVGSLNRVQAAYNSAILEQLSIGEAKNSTEHIQDDTCLSSNVHEVVKSLASFQWWETNAVERQEDEANYRWIFMQDWMQLSAEVQSQVSRLTIACFQCNVFGEMGEKLSRQSSYMQNHLLVFGNGLLKMIKNGNTAAASAAPEESWYQEDNEDVAQSVFIAQYLHLVKVEDFHRCLACQRHDVFRSWSLLMDAAKESILDTGGNVERILTLLGALSGKRCNRRQALKVAESISPRDVIYSLQRIHVDRSTLLAFMEALWNRPSYRTMRWGLWDVKEVLELHPHFYLYWVTNLLQDDHNSPVVDFKCSRGLPRPLSNHHPWKWKSLLCQIFNDVKHDKLQENFTQLCLQFGFWPGYLILLRRASERDKLLQTLIYLDDKLLLENQKLGYVPESPHEWEFVLQLTLRMADTLACDKRTLNFEEVAKLMVKFLPVTQAIKVLQKVHENTSTSSWKLSNQFYLSCIMQQIARQKYKSMTQMVLENTASHLWTQRSIAGPPQVVEEMLKEEREPSSNHNIQCTKFLDNLQCHWGISVDLTKDCAFCQQPLAKASSSRGYLGGVVVFICGHALHQLCSCDDICCMCQVPRSMQRPEA